MAKTKKKSFRRYQHKRQYPRGNGFPKKGRLFKMKTLQRATPEDVTKWHHIVHSTRRNLKELNARIRLLKPGVERSKLEQKIPGKARAIGRCRQLLRCYRKYHADATTQVPNVGSISFNQNDSSIEHSVSLMDIDTSSDESSNDESLSAASSNDNTSSDETSSDEPSSDESSSDESSSDEESECEHKSNRHVPIRSRDETLKSSKNAHLVNTPRREALHLHKESTEVPNFPSASRTTTKGSKRPVSCIITSSDDPANQVGRKERRAADDHTKAEQSIAEAQSVSSGAGEPSNMLASSPSSVIVPFEIPSGAAYIKIEDESENETTISNSNSKPAIHVSPSTTVNRSYTSELSLISRGVLTFDEHEMILRDRDADHARTRNLLKIHKYILHYKGVSDYEIERVVHAVRGKRGGWDAKVGDVLGCERKGSQKDGGLPKLPKRLKRE